MHVTKCQAVSRAALLRESVRTIVFSSVCDGERSAACPCFARTRLQDSQAGLCVPLICGVTDEKRWGRREEKFSFTVYQGECWHLHFYLKKKKNASKDNVQFGFQNTDKWWK